MQLCLIIEWLEDSLESLESESLVPKPEKPQKLQVGKSHWWCSDTAQVRFADMQQEPLKLAGFWPLRSGAIALPGPEPESRRHASPTRAPFRCVLPVRDLLNQPGFCGSSVIGSIYTSAATGHPGQGHVALPGPAAGV